MEETDPYSTANKLRLRNEEDRIFLLTIRAELQMMSERMEPGSEYEHKGYLLTRIMAPFPDVEEPTALSALAAMSRSKH
jgi:hypothetical protein